MHLAKKKKKKKQTGTNTHQHLVKYMCTSISLDLKKQMYKLQLTEYIHLSLHLRSFYLVRDPNLSIGLCFMDSREETRVNVECVWSV